MLENLSITKQDITQQYVLVSESKKLKLRQATLEGINTKLKALTENKQEEVVEKESIVSNNKPNITITDSYEFTKTKIDSDSSNVIKAIKVKEQMISNLRDKAIINIAKEAIPEVKIVEEARVVELDNTQLLSKIDIEEAQKSVITPVEVKKEEVKEEIKEVEEVKIVEQDKEKLLDEVTNKIRPEIKQEEVKVVEVEKEEEVEEDFEEIDLSSLEGINEEVSKLRKEAIESKLAAEKSQEAMDKVNLEYEKIEEEIKVAKQTKEKSQADMQKEIELTKKALSEQKRTLITSMQKNKEIKADADRIREEKENKIDEMRKEKEVIDTENAKVSQQLERIRQLREALSMNEIQVEEENKFVR